MLSAFGDAQYPAVPGPNGRAARRTQILDTERYVPSLALFRSAIAEQVEVEDTPVLRHIGGVPPPDDRQARGEVKQVLDRSLAHAGGGRCTIASQSGFCLRCRLRSRSRPWRALDVREGGCEPATTISQRCGGNLVIRFIAISRSRHLHGHLALYATLPHLAVSRTDRVLS